jgi:hypothetical protein
MQFGNYLFPFDMKEFLVSNSVPDSVPVLAHLLYDYDSLRMLPQGHKPHVASSTLCPIGTTLLPAALCHIDTWCAGGGHSTRPDFSAFGIFLVEKREGQRMYDRSFQHSLLRTEDLAASLITRTNVCNIPCASWGAGVPMEFT